MTQIRIFLVFIVTLFILTGCNLEQNADDDASLSETERSFAQEDMIIDVSFISSEAGTDLRIKLPNGVNAALSDFASEIVTRDVNNGVQRWSLEIDEDSSEVMESISFDASNINSIALHFYSLESGAPIADCISISELPSTNFSCALRFLEDANGSYANSNNDQYINVNVKSSDQFSLEGAIVSSECYGPLGVLKENLGTAEAALSTFIPNYIYGVLEIYKEGQHAFFQRDYSSDGIGYYSFTFPNGESSAPLLPNNTYRDQQLKLYGPEQTVQIISLPDFQSAHKSAHTINSYSGISASAQTKVTISKVGINYKEGNFSLNLNGQVIRFVDIEAFVQDINESQELSVNAFIDQAGNAIIIDEKGDDMTIEICSSYTGNSLVISGNPNAGPIVLGGTPSSDRIVTVGGIVTWQEEEGYELEMSVDSILGLQAGYPNTQLPNR